MNAAEQLVELVRRNAAVATLEQASREPEKPPDDDVTQRLDRIAENLRRRGGIG